MKRSPALAPLSRDHQHALDAERLAAHVRFEERELFATLEQRLDPAALARLGEDVAAAERDGNSAPGAE